VKCPLCGGVMLHKVTDEVFHSWICLEPHTREQWNTYVKESGDPTTAEDQEIPPERGGG
jgi:hypothetical protein